MAPMILLCSSFLQNRLCGRRLHQQGKKQAKQLLVRHGKCWISPNHCRCQYFQMLKQHHELRRSGVKLTTWRQISRFAGSVPWIFNCCFPIFDRRKRIPSRFNLGMIVAWPTSLVEWNAGYLGDCRNRQARWFELLIRAKNVIVRLIGDVRYGVELSAWSLQSLFANSSISFPHASLLLRSLLVTSIGFGKYVE